MATPKDQLTNVSNNNHSNSNSERINDNSCHLAMKNASQMNPNLNIQQFQAQTPLQQQQQQQQQHQHQQSPAFYHRPVLTMPPVVLMGGDQGQDTSSPIVEMPPSPAPLVEYPDDDENSIGRQYNIVADDGFQVEVRSIYILV